MRVRDSLDILVVGGGSFGTALASLLAEIGRRVRLWVRREETAEEINKNHRNSRYFPEQKLPRNLRATTDLAGVIRTAPIVLTVIPSRSFRQVASEIGNHIQGDQILVHATKGIEIETFKRMSEILREETCSLKIGVLSGPNLAGEIMARHPAGATVASRYQEVVDRVQAVFRSDRMRVYGGHDVIGTELGGAFKNIIALAAGAVDGMGFGDNTKALLMTRGLSEMARFGVALGADVFTFGGLAGIGDLITTCASPLSRNRRVGMALAKGEKLDDILTRIGQVAEGVPTTVAVHRQAMAIDLDLPIVRAVHATLYEGVPPIEALADLMRLPIGSELASLRYR